MSATSMGITPLNDGVLLDIYDDGEIPMMVGGIRFYTISDVALDSPHARDGHTKHPGIRARWALVVAVSDKAEQEAGLKVGDKVLCEHGRWTPGFTYDSSRKKAWWIKHTDILLVDEGGLTKEEKLHMKERAKRA